MRLDVRSVSLIVMALAIQACAIADEKYDPPRDPEPLNETLVQNVTLQINGGDERALANGATHEITGEFDLCDEDAPLEFMMVKLLIHTDRSRNGEAIIAEALVEQTHVEGSRYSFTSDLILLPGWPTGQVELRLVTIPPGKRGQDPIYRETVTLLPTPGTEPE